MGTKNRERRRAKQARQAKRQQEPDRRDRSGRAATAGRGDSLEGDRRAVDRLVIAAAHARCDGRGDEAELIALLASGCGRPEGCQLVADRLSLQLASETATVLSRGWTLDEACRVVRRKATAAAAEILSDVCKTPQPAAGPTSRPAQKSMFDNDDASRARRLDPGSPRFAADVAAAVAAVGVLAHLPPLADLGSDRSGDRSASQSPGASGDDPVLARVRALLAKAESTEFAEEADAFMAKAQDLMTRHSLDRALLEQDPGVAPVVVARRIWLDDPYVQAKSLLVSVVAESSRCQAVASSDLGVVTVVGHPDDCEIVELLVTSLLVQATRHISALATRAPSGWSSASSRAPSFRRSFLVAFASRIGKRLEQTSRDATADVAAQLGAALLPVLARREGAVDDAVGKLFPGAVRNSLAATNQAGWIAGRAAADLADLAVGPTLDSR
jgi:hypothetical protein